MFKKAQENNPNACIEPTSIQTNNYKSYKTLKILVVLMEFL